MSKRPAFILHICPGPNIDPIRALRQWLKIGLRTFRLRCVYIAEQTEEVNGKPSRQCADRLSSGD
jgi:hypothetical protein